MKACLCMFSSGSFLSLCDPIEIFRRIQIIKIGLLSDLIRLTMTVDYSWAFWNWNSGFTELCQEKQ